MRSESTKPRLVIADDEADIRRLIVFLLQRSYELYEAQDGRRALELVREVQPDLALFDIMMPGMTGLEVLKAMRTDPLTASIPVVFLSAKGQVAEIEAGLLGGATRYLIKPFESQMLRACIAEVLREDARAPVKE